MKIVYVIIILVLHQLFMDQCRRINVEFGRYFLTSARPTCTDGDAFVKQRCGYKGIFCKTNLLPSDHLYKRYFHGPPLVRRDNDCKRFIFFRSEIIEK